LLPCNRLFPIGCWLLFTFIHTSFSYGQTIRVQAEAEALDVLLAELHENYDLEFSFDAALVASCSLSINQQFDTPAEALAALTSPCQLTFRKVGEVYVITTQKTTTSLPSKQTTSSYRVINAQVVDFSNKEPLPFAHVCVQNSWLSTDANGYFSYRTKDSLVHICVSHLGYYIFDSTLSSLHNHQLALHPAITNLQEVVIKSNTYVKSLDLTDQSAMIKVNPPTTPFLPGNTSNSIFSFLRLQAGILAAGEQSNDYIIWGSYKGQSHIIFDGITIFNTASFNDEISIINPLIVKDIEVLKGGYTIPNGDRVGGVVNITSHLGHKKKRIQKLVLTDHLINSYINIPIAEKASFQIAHRLVFPKVLSPRFFNKAEVNRHFFGDINLRYTHLFKQKDQLNVSLIANFGKFTQASFEKTKDKKYEIQREQNRLQIGGMLEYSKRWKKLGTTNFQATYSYLNAYHANIIEFDNTDSTGNNADDFVFNITENGMTEATFKVRHVFPSSRHNHISLGAAYIHNSVKPFQINRNTAVNPPLPHDFGLTNSHRLNVYIKDDISILHWLNLRAGLRLELPLLNQIRPYLQPRINLLVRPHRHWNIKLAYGIYHQFIGENTVIDANNNYLYDWTLCDNDSIPVLQGMHYVADIGFDYEFISGKVEGFYKTTNKISQFYRDQQQDLTLMYGDSRSYGVDLFLQTSFLKQKIWISYTLSRTEERFENLGNSYRRAPHDQRHEFKAAGIFNFHACFVSVNYIYGSGFPNTRNLNSEKNIRPYHRLDIAFLYQWLKPKYKVEVGFSVLNVFNHKNIRYNNFLNFPDNTTKYRTAVPITPTLFATITF